MIDATILQTIRDISARKVAKGKAPAHVTRRELDREIQSGIHQSWTTEQVNDSLNSLWKAGRIHVGATLNDKYIWPAKRTDEPAPEQTPAGK
jgi:hypothetical protein